MKKLLVIALLSIIVSCSDDNDPIQQIEELPIIGTVKYVVDSSVDKNYIKYFNENAEEKTVILNKKHWEYTFQAKKDDLVYVIAQNNAVSVVYIYIYFNDEIIYSKGCSSNGELTCWGITKIP